jgi:phosphoribosylformylglycinamidine synthase II
VALSALRAIHDLGLAADEVRTFRKYWFAALETETLERLAGRILANDAIEQCVFGSLELASLSLDSKYEFKLETVRLAGRSDEELLRISREGQLSLSLAEMKTIQAYYAKLDRDPTDVELETIAQTWSEHCSHKTLKGRIRYRDEQGERQFENMLKETIFAATVKVRQNMGANDWCVSVFEDNAGIVRFDDNYNVVFKVETHNHPSAIEPYGGANTGLGGVIRDSLGTGLGARPICNTDVFCFAPPDFPPEDLPRGVLHPRRVMRGVVAGVRDYGNRMGIPTVNGAIFFDRRYLGNPLVFCGNVGLIPCDKSHKEPKPGDLIVVVGGRTGKDGLHGATFSSVELTHESETVSGGAVQIGNAITEKMVVDVILQARDRGLFNAITDCGAGGLSSAVGEMGEKIGAEVHLERVPLKYAGLSYTEIWISEAQERMVLAVPPEKWEEFSALCRSESVEATAIGTFVPTGKLNLLYENYPVGELEMAFLHDGRPGVVREAAYLPPPVNEQPLPDKYNWDYTPELLSILGSLNVCSKEWVIRQYDHEVQGGSVVKPLVGINNDGPSDAAVVRPVLGSNKAVVIACGMNPAYGDYDPYHMAAGAIDEAVRNCVAVGADPSRIAILDNFCWGNTERPEQLGSLVRAALGCHDTAIAFGTPFISGKDSLNNEFRPDDGGAPIAIPASLLISAMGQMDDATQAVTMDLKQPGNYLYQLGWTRDEMGGSQFALTQSLAGGQVPRVDTELARRIFAALHRAITAGYVASCHDLSEGGLAAAAAESAFAGGLGARLFLAQVPQQIELDPASQEELDQLSESWSGDPLHPLCGCPQATSILLFAESHSRFLCEVPEQHAAAFEALFADLPCGLIGEVIEEPRLQVIGIPRPEQSDSGQPTELSAPLVIDAELAALKEAWQAPLRWD